MFECWQDLLCQGTPVGCKASQPVPPSGEDSSILNRRVLEPYTGRSTHTAIRRNGENDMSSASSFIGFADITTPLPIKQVAEMLSSRVFGGIRFIEKDVDGEHDLGTLCLAQDFLGMQVDLFGGDGGFTLELATRPSAIVAEFVSDVCDVSSILKQRIKTECRLEVT